MPLSDSESKNAYDSTLHPEEEQPRYWDVHTTITLEYITQRYGTKDEVMEIEMDDSTAFAELINPHSYSVVITEITEQEGE